MIFWFRELKKVTFLVRESGYNYDFDTKKSFLGRVGLLEGNSPHRLCKCRQNEDIYIYTTKDKI